MHYFYSSISVQNGHWELAEEEWRHIKALRIKEGEHIMLTDGIGGRCEAIFHLSNKIPSLESFHVFPMMESLKGLTVGIPVTQDTDRLEWFIEKSVELGVAGVQLIQTEWSVPVKYSLHRLRKIAIAAMKQSQRAWLPEIQDQINCQRLLELYPTASIYFAHCQGGDKKEWNAISKSEEDILLIGPEGDFSPKEVEQLLCHKATPVSLGLYRLRTETAALAAIAYYNLSK